jgi:ribonuclease HI
MLKKVHVYVAGICAPENPGGIGVMGFSVFDELENLICHKCGSAGNAPVMTDMLAEHISAAAALEWILSNHPSAQVVLNSDSHRLINHLSGRWKVRNPQLAACQNRTKHIEKLLPSIEYVLLERKKDPRQRELKLAVRKTFSDLNENARKTARATGRFETSLAIKGIDENKIRILVDSMHQFMMINSSPQEAYFAVKILQDSFERLIGFKYKGIEDAKRVMELTERILGYKFAQGRECSATENQKPPKGDKTPESNIMYG